MFIGRSYRQIRHSLRLLNV